MPLDLYRTESLDRISSLPPVENPEAGAFDGFVRGSATYTMRGFATTARAIDMLGAVGPIAQDAFTGGTEAQDRYFREHDEVFGSAVDYWTPRPNEVGVAGQVVGGLASLLPKVILSPGLAVGSEQLSAGEELVAKGVPPAKALTVGAIQGAATGLGLWVPILGRNLWERLLVGGAGYNVTQGVATRGASQLILADTEAAKDFRAFDPEAMTLDALLGMAFGTLAHVSPEARAQGRAAWERIQTWAERLNPSDVDAIAALRQAEHLNVDSAPGKPIGPEDVIAHVERMRTAIDQLAKDRPVEVTDHPSPDVAPATPEETAALQQRFAELRAEAERVRQEEGLPHPDDLERAITEAATLETPYEITTGRVPFEITPEMARRERLQEIAFERDLATPEQAPVLDAEVARIREELRTPSEGAPTPQTLEAQIERATPQLGPQERKAYQDLTQAFYEATAKRAGLTPEQLYERFPLEVVGGRVAPPGALEQAMPIFYSELAQHLEASPMKEAPAKGWKDYIRGLAGKGVKKEEVKWSGIEDWLDAQQGKVTKDQVRAFLEQGGVKVDELVLGQPKGLTSDEHRTLRQLEATPAARLTDAQVDELTRLRAVQGEPDLMTGEVAGQRGATKFGSYQLPGGENYRELLLTLPVETHDAIRAHAARLRELKARWAELSNQEATAARDRELRNTEVQIGLVEAAGVRPTFQSTHFEAPNVLAHIRFNDRVDADGKKVLFVEEIQSDWAQRGKAQRFATDQTLFTVYYETPRGRVDVAFGPTREAALATADAAAWENIPGVHLQVEAERIKRPGIPQAPFVGKTESWVALSLKRMIRYAAEHGYERLAWTTGEQQVTRYGQALREQVDAIEWKKTPEGVQLVGYKGGTSDRFEDLSPALRLAIRDVMRENDNLGFDTLGEALGAVREHPDWRTRWDLRDRADTVPIERYLEAVRIAKQTKQRVVDTTQKETELSDAIGKAMADKIRNDPAQEGTIEGADLKIDDTGMAGFYDRIVPNVANDVLKKLGGGRVGKVELAVGGQDETSASHPGFDITPALRERALKGMPLFQGGPGAARGYYAAGERPLIGLLEHADRSTFLHESGHFYLDVLNELAGEGHPDIAADRDTLLNWFGVKDSAAWDQMNLEARRPYHEQFARGFETYLGEGVAPTEGLRAVFERFKEWLLAIYQSLTKLNAPISDEVRGVMARMLGGEHPTEPPPAETGPGPTRIAQEPLPPAETQAPAEAPNAQAPPEGAPAAPTPAAAGEFPAPARPKARATGQVVEVSPEQAFALRELGREAGWLEMGGRLDMSRLADPEKLGTPAFTKWVPKAEWWLDFVRTPGAKLNEVELRRAIDKAAQGEPLRKQEQRAVEYLLPLAEEHLAQYGPGTVEHLMEREAIQAEPKDRIAAAADRFVLQHPDLELTVGQNADGTPIRARAAEVLTQAREARARAEEDAQLVRAAAQCLLGD